MSTEAGGGLHKTSGIKPAVEYKSPLISSGKDKGRVRDPLSSRLLADSTIKEARAKAIQKYPRPRREEYPGQYLKNREGFVRLYMGKEDGSLATLDMAHEWTIDIQMAQLDPMTGLIRKEYFDRELELVAVQARNRGEGFGVFRLDLDFFSWINDALKAHAMGDLYLGEMGYLIRSSIKNSKGDEAFRLGGDEAGVLLNRKLTPAGFLAAVARLHKVLNGDKDNPTPILKRTLDKALKSTGERKTKSGKIEREGTVALKEFLWGLYCIKNNIVVDEVGARDDFRENARGSESSKNEFLERLDQLHLDGFKDYLSSHQVYSELSESERKERYEIETDVVRVIMLAFSNLSASVAGVYVGPGDEIDVRLIHEIVDKQVYAVKSKGRGGWVVVDTEGNQIEDRRRNLRDLSEAGGKGAD